MNTGLSWFDPVTHWMESLQLKIHYRHRKQQFDRMFARGDAFDTRGAYEQFKYSECLALLNIPPARFRRVLEIGCAEGAFTERLAPHTDELVAMDLAEPAVARAREALRAFPHVHVRLENIATANFDAPFDLVIASDVIYYLGQEHSEHHLDEMLARFAQWVQPGGRILIANGYKLNVATDDWFHRKVMVGYRVTLERQGLRLLRERDLSGANVGSEATCLLSLLEKPDDGLSPRVPSIGANGERPG